MPSICEVASYHEACSYGSCMRFASNDLVGGTGPVFALLITHVPVQCCDVIVTQSLCRAVHPYNRVHAAVEGGMIGLEVSSAMRSWAVT